MKENNVKKASVRSLLLHYVIYLFLLTLMWRRYLELFSYSASAGMSGRNRKLYLGRAVRRKLAMAKVEPGAVVCLCLGALRLW